MATRTERFNKERILLQGMEKGPKLSLKEIANHIESSLDKFVAEHGSELVHIVRKGDYEDVPQLPIYEQFYFGTLVPQIREMMTKSGHSEEEIKKMIGYGDELFYREILPSVCRNGDDYKRNGDCHISQNPP